MTSPERGQVPYDELAPAAQAERRAEWDRGMDARRAALNLEIEFLAEGRSWVELDDSGLIVHRPSPGG